MKCHLQNKDANCQCSASCTTGGPWNCVEDATCPNAGTGGGTSCINLPTTDVNNACASPLKGTAPCSGKDPICANSTNAIKRQSDASWYCAQGTTFVDFAICPRGTSAPTGTQISFVVGLDGIG